MYHWLCLPLRSDEYIQYPWTYMFYESLLLLWMICLVFTCFSIDKENEMRIVPVLGCMVPWIPGIDKDTIILHEKSPKYVEKIRKTSSAENRLA